MQALDLGAHLDPQLRVEVRERLVEKEQLGFSHQRPAHGDPLTLAVGSRLYLNEFKYLWGDFAAAAILSGVPITIVFLIAQKYLVSGLGEGAVKG